MDNRKIFFQNKKNAVSFVLSLLVFFIHFQVFSVFKDADGMLRRSLDLLLIPAEVAVPLFFLISGVMFYRDYTWKSTARKWKNRFFSLCIPYLVWNTVWLILALLGNYTPLGAFLGGVKAELTFENVLLGIFRYRYFEPFWFMYQLIVVTALCPVIYLLLKNKWVGLIGIIALYMASCFGFRFPEILFPNSNMVLLYLLGAWIGLHHFPAFHARRSKPQALAAFCVFILCCVLQGLAGQLPRWWSALQMPLLVTVVSCGAFWIAFDYFDMQKCPGYVSCSFWIYALHSLVGAAVSKVLDLLLPSGQGYLWLTAIIAFPATVVIICAVGRLFHKHFPHLQKLLTGK